MYSQYIQGMSFPRVNFMDYKEKIESRLAIADGLEKNLSFDAFDSTPRQPRKYSEDWVSPRGKHYPGMIIQELEDSWRGTPKSPTRIQATGATFEGSRPCSPF